MDDRYVKIFMSDRGGGTEFKHNKVMAFESEWALDWQFSHLAIYFVAINSSNKSLLDLFPKEWRMKRFAFAG